MTSKALTRSEVHALTKNARSTAEGLLDRVERLKHGVAQGFYEMGRCLAELFDKKLHGSLGYASFDAMLEDRAIMSQVQAYKLIEVARRFSKPDAMRLGAEKAYALVRHVARTKQADDPAEYLLEGFPVGGRRRPIEDVTVREIQEATRTAVSHQKGEHGASERARRDAESIRRKVRAAMKKRAGDGADVRLLFRHGAWRLQVDLPAELAASAVRV